MTTTPSASLPPPWPDNPLPEIRCLASGRPLIALDDDPTGTQTVRDVPVLTRWPADRMEALLRSQPAVAYLLTNSRSLSVDDAVALGRSVGTRLHDAAVSAGTRLSIASRSDSTLRGHFPHEVDALAAGLGLDDARVLLAPFFGDGGRVTIGGIHYLRKDGQLHPVATTEFARDPVFGFQASDLRAWVAERSAGDPRPVAHVDLHEMRGRGPDAVSEALQALPPRGVLAVDAEDERDIEVVALGALRAELAGLPLIARSAASYVRARAGQSPAAPLGHGELLGGTPGVIVVGSHVPTTTRQLSVLMDDPPTGLARFELDVPMLLADPGGAASVATDLAVDMDAALARGVTPVLSTSRVLARGEDATSDLGIGALVSRSLVEVVQRLHMRPSWVLAKGGITSSDIATHGLGVDEATVIGPLLPGVPAWRCGPRSRWPGLTYIVFPGNVGDSDAVRQAVARLCS